MQIQCWTLKRLTGMCEKNAQSHILCDRAPPLPPDLNVESGWLEGSGLEVRNKRTVYVRAVVVLMRLFNIEIAGGGGDHRRHAQSDWAFFSHIPDSRIVSVNGDWSPCLLLRACGQVGDPAEQTRNITQ